MGEKIQLAQGRELPTLAMCSPCLNLCAIDFILILNHRLGNVP